MTTHTDNTENFLNTTTVAERSLIEAFIQKMGGESVFFSSFKALEDWSDIANIPKITLPEVFVNNKEIVDFYNDNKDAVLDFAYRQAVKRKSKSIAVDIQTEMKEAEDEGDYFYMTAAFINSSLHSELTYGNLENVHRMAITKAILKDLGNAILLAYVLFMNPEQRERVMVNAYIESRVKDGPYNFLLSDKLARALVCQFSCISPDDIIVTSSGYLAPRHLVKTLGLSASDTPDLMTGSHTSTKGFMIAYKYIRGTVMKRQYHGFSTNKEIRDFYIANQKDLLAYIKKSGAEVGYKSVVDAIHAVIGQDYIDDRGYDYDDIAEAIYTDSKKSTDGNGIGQGARSAVMSHVVLNAAMYLCTDFDEYIKGLDNPVVKPVAFKGEVRLTCMGISKFISIDQETLRLIAEDQRIKGLQVKIDDGRFDDVGLRGGTYNLTELLAVVSGNMPKVDDDEIGVIHLPTNDDFGSKEVLVALHGILNDFDGRGDQINKATIEFSGDDDGAFIEGTFSYHGLLLALSEIIEGYYYENWH